MSPQWMSVIVAGLALIIAILTYRNTRASTVESNVEKAIDNIVGRAIDKHCLDKSPHNGKYVTPDQMRDYLRDCREARRREVDAELHRRKTREGGNGE
jgi:hypothetical protein